MSFLCCFFFFKQKTAYEMRISDWSSDVCSSDLASDAAWGEAACMIARGGTMKAVADHLRCSRSTLWRTLQSSERLRTRIAEERRFLAVEAASRFKGLHGAALEATEEIGRASCREGGCPYV